MDLNLWFSCRMATFGLTMSLQTLSLRGLTLEPKTFTSMRDNKGFYVPLRPPMKSSAF